MTNTIESSIQPMEDTIRSLIIKHWGHTIQQITQHSYYNMNGADVYHNEVKSAVFGLYMIIKSSFDAEQSQETLEKVKNSFKEKKCRAAIETFELLNSFLYTKGLTKIDNMRMM